MSCKKPFKPVDRKDNYLELLKRYQESNQTPKEFFSACLSAGILTAEDEKPLLNFLNKETLHRSYVLADVSDESFIRYGLYETSKDDCENSPLFIMQFDKTVKTHKDNILKLLEVFSKELIHLTIDNYKQQPDARKNLPIRKQQLEILENWEPDVLLS